jgi:hypothetical protein
MLDFALSDYTGNNLFYFGALLPGLTGVVSLWLALKMDRGKAAMVATAVGTFLVAAVLAYGGYAVNALSLSAGDDGVAVDGPIYGASYSREAIDVDGARTVDLSGADADLKPTKRTNGMGLSNLRYGWFVLANGERALLALSHESRAVYVPTREGHSLLVSPEDPDAFLAALRSGQ